MEAIVFKWEGSYGFARMAGRTDGIFVHQNVIVNGRPAVGDRLRLDTIEDTPRGLRATGWVEIMAEPEPGS